MVAKTIPEIVISLNKLKDLGNALAELGRAMEQVTQIVQKQPYPQSNGQLCTPIRPFMVPKPPSISLWETMTKIRLSLEKHKCAGIKAQVKSKFLRTNTSSTQKFGHLKSNKNNYLTTGQNNGKKVGYTSRRR